MDERMDGCKSKLCTFKFWMTLTRSHMVLAIDRDTEDDFWGRPTHQGNVPNLAETEDRRELARGVLRQVHALVAQDHVHVDLVNRLGDHHARLVGPDPLIDAPLRVPLQERVKFAVPSGECVHGAHSGHGVRVRAHRLPPLSSKEVACELSRDGVPYVLKKLTSIYFDYCEMNASSCALQLAQWTSASPKLWYNLIGPGAWRSLLASYTEVSDWPITPGLGYPMPVGLFTAEWL